MLQGAEFSFDQRRVQHNGIVIPVVIFHLTVRPRPEEPGPRVHAPIDETHRRAVDGRLKPHRLELAHLLCHEPFKAGLVPDAHRALFREILAAQLKSAAVPFRKCGGHFYNRLLIQRVQRLNQALLGVRHILASPVQKAQVTEIRRPDPPGKRSMARNQHVRRPVLDIIITCVRHEPVEDIPQRGVRKGRHIAFHGAGRFQECLGRRQGKCRLSLKHPADRPEKLIGKRRDQLPFFLSECRTGHSRIHKTCFIGAGKHTGVKLPVLLPHLAK